MYNTVNPKGQSNFFAETNKINKLLSKLLRQKEKKTQITNIKGE